MAAAGSSAGPARRGAAGAGVGGGESGRPLRPAAAARNLQEAAGPGEGGEGSGLDAGVPGRRESGVPREEARGRKARGRAREDGELRGLAATPALRATGGGGSRVAVFPFPPENDLASPGRAGAAARAAQMARFRAAERAPSRSLSGLGTCPSASRGLLSMESEASRRPHRAGSQRAQLGDQARRRMRPRAASPLPAPSLPAGSAPTQPRLLPPSRAVAEPGLPALVPCVLPASLTALFTGTASAS